jgi:predicted GNAT superfamily acetyltransferase
MAVMREISVDDALFQSEGLFQRHWSELATNKDLMVLKPDVERYKILEKGGVLLAIGAFLREELVGYSVSFITHHMHYADLIHCQNDILFVDKPHRKGAIGIKLMLETEKLAKERGAHLMCWHAKKDTSLAGMLPRMGYRVQDIVFSKGL